jgi:hypothetical protein
MKKNTAIAPLALAVLAFTQVAKADIVQFSASPSTTFAAGTFSTNVSGVYPDGFFQISSTSAFNGYGQTGESIFFTNPVTLNSLSLSNYFGNPVADSITVSLFNGSHTLLTSQTIAPTNAAQILTFNTTGVSQVTFDQIATGINVYGDGRLNVAWYDLTDVTYNASAAPGPLPGSGLAGFALLALAGIALRHRGRIA